MIPIPADYNPGMKLEELFVNDDFMLNLPVFSKYFTLDRFKVITVSKIGPIEKIQSSITRKSDGKVLSTATNIESGMGWLNNLLTNGYGSQNCPKRQETHSTRLPEDVEGHLNIVKRTFYLR